MKIIKKGNVYKRAGWLKRNAREILEILSFILTAACLYMFKLLIG